MARTQKAAEAAAQTGTAMQERGNPAFQYDVKIHSLYPEGSCKALASVNLNGSFAIRGVKVMEGANGLFVSMPSYRTGNGDYKDVCFPCTREARNEMSGAVLHAYRQSLAQNQSQENQGQAAAAHDQAALQMSM